MNLQLKDSINTIILFATCLTVIMACGKKNVVNTNVISNTSASINNLHSMACLNGNSRLARDVNFYLTGSFTGTKISGAWQPGVLTSGTNTDLYIGVSAFRDLMFLSKVTNGSQIVGYNLTLSFCEMPNAYPNYPKVISNDRPLVNFQAPYDIYINTATSCGYGLIAAAQNTVIISQRSPSNPYTWDAPIYTSFASASCP